MSRSLNRITIIGHVGGDPEVRNLDNGGRVASFSVATSVTWTGEGGAKQEKTEWHRVVAWNKSGNGGKLADQVEKLVKKGTKVYVEGPMEYRKWMDKDGGDRISAEIRATSVDVLANGAARDDDDAPPARSASRTSAPAASPKPAADFPDLGDDDDLPF